jgi:glycosyltransferase involved in cell wall biosynthesis
VVGVPRVGAGPGESKGLFPLTSLLGRTGSPHLHRNVPESSLRCGSVPSRRFAQKPFPPVPLPLDTHVLIANHRYYPATGGTELHAQVLAENLVLRGHHATVLTQQEPGVPEEEWIHGVRIVRIPTRTVAGARIPSGYLRRLRSIDADLFHLQGNRIWCADFYFPVARLFDWPQVLTGHGFYQYAMHPRPWDRWYFERYLPRMIEAFDAYIYRTEFERDQLVRWGVSPQRLQYIAEGADLAEFKSSPTPPSAVRARWALPTPRVAVYAGGFFENKRVDRLIESVAPIRDRWGLVLLGRDLSSSPYNAAYCTALARKLGVSIRIQGSVPRPEVVSSFLAADAIVSASEWEGFGISIAEALAAGRPFVAWRAGAIPEMAATGAGIVVDSQEAFTKALIQLEDDKLREDMGRRGLAVSPNWSTDLVLSRHFELYRRLTSG